MPLQHPPFVPLLLQPLGAGSYETPQGRGVGPGVGAGVGLPVVGDVVGLLVGGAVLR